MNNVCDKELADLIRGVAVGNRRSVVKLGRFLRSSKPLASADRALLADLVMGRVSPKKVGRPCKMKVSPANQRCIVANYLEKIRDGELAKNALADVMAESNIVFKKSLFYKWLSEIKPIIEYLEDMNKDAISLMKQT